MSTKKSLLRYTALGLFAYLIFLLYQTPAALLYSLVESSLKQQDDSIAAYGISGSLWQGEIARLDVAGETFHELSWRLHPADLFLGTASASVYARMDEGYVRARVEQGLGDKLVMKNIDARVSARQLLALANVPALKLEGDILFNLERLVLEARHPVAAEGRIAWHGATTLFPQKLVLGDLAASLSTDEAGIKAQLSDGGGPLELTGDLLLKPDGDYSLQGQLAARKGRNSALGRSLRFVGRPDAKGKVKLSQSGTLAELGIRVE